MARHPNDQDRRQVEMMAGYGIPGEDIARVLGIPAARLRSVYGHELSTGHVRANSEVAQSLFEKAKGGHVLACIFWLKVRAGWVERKPEDDGVKKQKERAADTAGLGTEWASDLEFENRAN